ncbi:Protein FAM5C [Tupaia chinensis]|uniref:Protein FAM5C n=1 Tax=Tupaia chinensis TaxID=246437 RepID=L9KFR0_TUPCH|nr:Protein FAM5C [Tupaia chinensis]
MKSTLSSWLATPPGNPPAIDWVYAKANMAEAGLLLDVQTREESLTIFVDKRKLSKRSEGSDSSTNSSSVTLETLHQLAASYFIDRDSTLRRLHHIQIASTAIKVRPSLC